MRKTLVLLLTLALAGHACSGRPETPPATSAPSPVPSATSDAASAASDAAGDAARIEALAARLLPGATSPPGMKGVQSLEAEGVEIAILAPSPGRVGLDTLQGRDLRVVIAGVGTEDEQKALGQVRAALESSQAPLKQTRQQVTEVLVAGRPHRTHRTEYALLEDGSPLLEYSLLLKPGGKPVVLQILGPENTFDQEAMLKFLAELQVR